MGDEGGNSLLGEGEQRQLDAPLAQGHQVSFASITTNLPKLDGTNYHSWIEMQELALEIRGWKGAITAGGATATINAQAKLMLLEAMNESHRAQVRGCATAKDIIERLRLIYADRSAANLYRLLHQYYRYTKSANDTMSEHIGKMDEMRRKLADLGEKQSEAVYQVTLIGSLPAEYASLMEVWELTHKDMRTTENLVSRLLKREEDMKRSGNGGLALVAGNRSGRPRMSPEDWAEHVKKMTCYNCQEKGHLANKCKNQKKPRNNGDSRKEVGQDGQDRDQTAQLNTAEVNFMVNGDHTPRPESHTHLSLSPNGLKDKWVCDSGASSHMCNDLKWFETIKMADGDLGSCYIGNGKPVGIKGVGTVRVESLVDGSWIKSCLNKVHYVPELSTNLISVGQAGEHGVSTTFNKDSCIMSLNDQQVAYGAKLQDRLYLMRMRASTGGQQAALSVREDKTLEYYHKVLGHAGVDRVATLLKDLGIPVAGSKKQFECEHCPGGKGRHVTHPSVGVRASEPGVVHADLSGLVNKGSLQGFKYYLVCKDEFTEFTMTYFCKEKSEVPKLLAKMVIDFETLSGAKVREIHTDKGSEFLNHATEVLFLREKIKHLTSTPYCPHQNGRIEREMQTLTNMARTMLNGSGLTKDLWPEAILTATYIKNRLPTARTIKTPFERLTNRKPSIQHMVEFGTPVHAVINYEYTSKWEQRAEEGFVVGFTSRSNTYLVYVPGRNRVTEACDLYFARHRREQMAQENPRPSTSREETVISQASQLTSAGRDSPSNDDQLAGTGLGSGGDTHNVSRGQPTSTPVRDKNPRITVTGPRLEEFFRKFVEENQSSTSSNQPDYCACGSERSRSEKSEPIYQNIPWVNEATRPQPSAPPLDSDECASTCKSLDSYELEKMSGANLTHEEDKAGDNNPKHPSCAFVVTNASEQPPQNFQQAIESDEKDEWERAIAAELEAHEANQTWTEVETPAGAKLLTTKWVFDIKRDRFGNVERYKARLVARGFEQRAGVDFYETFAPVARLESIRTLFAICAIRRMAVALFDVSTAFLNGWIKEPVYIATPRGITSASGRCLKLNKALYGLKQAPRAWNSTFNETLIKLGFRRTLSDMCVYVNNKSSIFIAIYVDDGLVFADDEAQCSETIEELKKSFKLKQLEGNFFLGIEIEKEEGKIRLNQRRYTKDIIQRFNLEGCRQASCPIVDCKALMEADDEETSAPYREAIGCLQYLACVSRPDILFAVNFLSQFNNSPRNCHWQAVKRVLRYLSSSQDYCIVYEEDKSRISAYSDADWGNDLAGRRSVSGVLILIGGGPVIFASRKQPNVAQSSTEAEYVASCEAAKELKWLAQFLSELRVQLPRPTLFVDNESSIRQIESLDTKRRCKHIDLRFHFVKLEYQNQLFEIEQVGSALQLADLLTKGLNGAQIQGLLEKANMKRRAEKKIGLLSKIALITVILLCVPGASHSSNVTKVELTGYQVLIETPFLVAKGVNVVNLDIKFPDLCGIPTGNETESVYNIKSGAYSHYQGFCFKAFNEIGEKLQELAACLPQPVLTGMLSRVKRFFDPITALVVVSIVMIVWVAKTAVEYITPESDTNLTKKNVDSINRIKNHLNLSHYEDGLQKTMLKDTSERAEMNERALRQAAAIHTEVAWQTSITGLRIWDIKQGLKRILESCGEKRLSVTGLAQFIPLAEVPELQDVREKDTTLERLEVKGNDTLSITVNVNVIDKKCAVYQVVGLSHWANYTTKPVWVEYQGPQYVLINATSNCRRGIDKPIERGTFETCEQQDYSDPSLDYYVPSQEQDDASIANIAKPVVYDVGQSNIVHCQYKKITIGNAVFPCPAEPMKLDKDVSFKVANISYQGRQITSGTLKGKAYVQTERLLNITSPEFQRTAEMWSTIKEAYYNAGQRVKYDLQQQTVSVSMSFLEWGLTALTCVSSIITIAWFIGRMVRQPETGSGVTEQNREEESHSEQITIINQVPEPHLHSDSNHEYRSQLEALANLALVRTAAMQPSRANNPLPPLPPKGKHA